jgi:hypothetical protein
VGFDGIRSPESGQAHTLLDRADIWPLLHSHTGAMAGFRPSVIGLFLGIELIVDNGR